MCHSSWESEGSSVNCNNNNDWLIQEQERDLIQKNSRVFSLFQTASSSKCDTVQITKKKMSSIKSEPISQQKCGSQVSDNLHLHCSLISNDDVLGGFSYIVNLALITLQVLRPACFGHVLAVLAQYPAKRLHASLQSRLMSGLMGLSDTPVSAPVCFCLFEYGWMSDCLSVLVSLWIARSPICLSSAICL